MRWWERKMEKMFAAATKRNGRGDAVAKVIATNSLFEVE